MTNEIGKSVLIVENSLLSIFLLRKYISNEKIIVISTDNGFKAVSICQENPEIRLVIMDIELSRMDGIEATQKIKEYRKDLPVILHSSHSQYKEAAIHCGCDEFLNETMSNEIIRALLKKYINK
jgi:CheY-like chemotaxis protein